MIDFIIGIDPGKTGGICVLDSRGVIVEKGALDQESKDFDPNILFSQFSYVEDLVEGYSCMAIIEKVSAMPGQGVSSMFKFGTLYGYIRMAVVAMGWQYELIHPRSWTKIIHRGTEGSLSSKDKSKAIASRLFPKEDFKRNDRCKVVHDGIIDATLLAWYGHLKYNK